MQSRYMYLFVATGFSTHPLTTGVPHLHADRGWRQSYGVRVVTKVRGQGTKRYECAEDFATTCTQQEETQETVAQLGYYFSCSYSNAISMVRANTVIVHSYT